MSFGSSQRREIQSIIALSGANRRGVITSYQPSPPMVKVQIMPLPPATTGLPAETGWIPFKSWATGLGGAGWCVVAPPQSGQQVLLICEEADGQNYTAWGGYYSDVDPAPQGAGAGEILMQHQSGSQFYLRDDGSISIITHNLNIAAPNGGEAQVSVIGSITASVEIAASGKAFTPHTHSYFPGGGAAIQTGLPEE